MAPTAGATSSQAKEPSGRRIARAPRRDAATRLGIPAGTGERSSRANYASDFCRAASSLRPFGTVVPPRIMLWTMATALVSYSPYQGSL